MKKIRGIVLQILGTIVGAYLFSPEGLSWMTLVGAIVGYFAAALLLTALILISLLRRYQKGDSP